MAPIFGLRQYRKLIAAFLGFGFVMLLIFSWQYEGKKSTDVVSPSNTHSSSQVSNVSQATSATRTIVAKDLVGKWVGTFGTDDVDATLKIMKVDGSNFTGVMSVRKTVVKIAGNLSSEANNQIIFEERSVISGSRNISGSRKWSLGTNKGIVSPDRRSMTGKRNDGQHLEYSWSFAKK
jgi:hypothetical protein